MSKCQMRKFMAGGRCGGSTGGSDSNRGNESSLSSAYSNLMQQRALQEKGVFQQPSFTSETNTNSLQLVKKVEEKLSNSSQRARDIDFILNGDM